MRRALVALGVLLLLAGCSDDEPKADRSEPEAEDGGGDAEQDEVDLEDVGACTLLANDEIAEIVGSEVIGSSPVPGGDDACAFAYGDSTTVAPPDGPHVLLVVEREADSVEGEEVDGFERPTTWDDEGGTLTIQVGEGTVQLGLVDDDEADARGAATELGHVVEEGLDAPAEPSTTTTTSTTTPAAEVPPTTA